MSAESTMLLNMPMADAKALRMRYGDSKYGKDVRRDTSYLAEAYIEAVDISNYYDIALTRGELDHEQHAALQGLLSECVLGRLRRIIARTL